jgi:fatty-acyl-CoA synthase
MILPDSRSCGALLVAQAARFGDSAAVICADRVVSYSGLVGRARRVAAALRARGIVPGHRVGLLMNNRVEWIESFFGAAIAGAVVVPFSTWSKRDELRWLLEDSELRLLIALGRFGGQDFLADLRALVPEAERDGAWRSAAFPQLQDIVLLGEDAAPGMLRYADFGADGAPGEDVDADAPALVIYTSGSSSTPKAVPLTHRGMIENGFNIGERQGYRPGDRVLLAPPLFWSYGSANAMCATFTHGATLVLQPRFEPSEALDLIERHRCTALYTLPAMTAAMTSHPEFRRERTRSLRTGLTIGAPQDLINTAEVLGATEICNVYGQTESYGNCCVTPHDWPLARRAQCQGPPLPGVELRIVDVQSGAALPRGETGMIEVRGYVTRGYVGRSAAQNAQTFTDDGFFRTGDMGFVAEDGALVFLARTSEMIKKGGINISPAEVEDVLMRHPGVELAGVVGIADREQGEVMAAFVVPKQGCEPTAEELVAHCRATVSRYKSPDLVFVRDRLPTTPTGKLQRRELKQLAASLTRSDAAPAGTDGAAWGLWGAQDERGALNRIDTERVRRAATLVRTGEVIALAQELSPRTPLPPHRARMMHFMDRDGGDYAAGAQRPDGFQFAEDTIVLPLHSGTHIDALCHVWHDDRLYNGFASNNIRSTTGAKRCGVDKLPPIFTRGLLLDVAALRGGALPDGEAIGRVELERAAERAGVKPGEGDAVLLRTGWMDRQLAGESVSFDREPGIDVEAARWLARAGVALIGADNYAIEVLPFPAGEVFPVHRCLIRDYGIPLLEGLVLDGLAKRGVGEFLFVAAPLPIAGGTASPLTPFAVL